MNNTPKFISECILDILSHAQDEKMRNSFNNIKGLQLLDFFFLKAFIPMISSF